MIHDGAVEARGMSVIEERLSRLGSAVEFLAARMDVLEGRLRPALLPPVPIGSDRIQNVPSDPASIIATELAALDSKVQIITRSVNDMIDRCQI